MKKICIISMIAIFGCGFASANTYYVSSSAGNDSNNGTSATTAWQTIAHVNGQAFQPGDSILFKRGDVWNESLAPASSGSSGNPIAFDAYGTGAAPNLTGYYAVPATSWVLVTGNAWKAPVPSTYSTINFCLFGSVWGQKVAAVASNLTAKGDFYLANGFVYVFAAGNPATFYNEPIVPMGLSNVPVINVNGPTWLTFQHFLVNWFDQYGVYVQGTSDHLVFANMEADSMIPQGTQPLGFYVNENAPGPGDIKIYNSEAHLNYDAFRFDGAATAITMVNDKAYANRDGALVDNTSEVAYAYCHFYASSLAVAGSTDVEWTSGTGPIAGAGNIAVDTAPAVQVYQRYPAEVTLTVDDAGMTPGADSYYASTVLPVADAAGVPVGAAITVGYPLAQTLISEFQGWINAGRDVTAHSISHTYYTNTDALDIQYTGSGTAATLSINGNVFTVTVTGASDSVSYNLAQGQPQGTMLALAQALAATGKYTYSFLTPCQGPYGTGCSAYTGQALLTQDLEDVSGQDVKSAVYHMQLNVTQLTTDEITLSRQWMTTNLTGLPATPVFVYPGGYETTAMQGIAEGVPYSGARGALKEDLGVKDTYADGFNVQNITSFGVNPSWMGASGVTPAILNQKIQALVWKESVWGVPWGIFWHLNELTNDDPVGGTEITNLIQDFKASGATIQTNTSLVNWLLSGTQETGTDGNDYYTFPATSGFSSRGGLDFRPTKNSPVVDAGENLGTAYELDINGVNQNSYGSGWEIGAHVYEGYATYGENLPGSYFTIGGMKGTAPNYSQARQDTAIAQLPSPIPSVGGLMGAGTCVTPSDFGLTICRETDSTWDPQQTVSNSFIPPGNDTNKWSCNNTFIYFANPSSRVYVGAFTWGQALAHLYPTNAAYSSRGGFSANEISGGWSWSCATTPNRLYLKNTVSPNIAIQSYDFTGWQSNPSGSPAIATLVDFRTGQGFCGAAALPSGATLPNNWSEMFGPAKLPADGAFSLAMALQQAILSSAGDTVSVTNGSANVTMTGSVAMDTSGELTHAWININGVHYNIATVGTYSAGTQPFTLTTNYAGTTNTGVEMDIPTDQESGFDIMVYKPGLGCAHLNTATGLVTSDYGVSGTVSISDRITLHGHRITPDGHYIFMSTNNCVTGISCTTQQMGYLWDTTSLNMYLLCDPTAPSGSCGGHNTDGFTHIFNAGAPDGQLNERLYGSLEAYTQLIPTPPMTSGGFGACTGSPTEDTHISYQDVDPLDSWPVITASSDYPAAYLPGTFTCPLVNEIYAINPTNGTVYRFAHNFLTGANWNYSDQNAFGSVSDDGAYQMFGSDWTNASGVGTLGQYNLGSGACVNSPSGPTACRGDIFVVNLTATPVF